MHENLTNEGLRDLYSNAFQLTSEAIALAQNKIRAGKEFSLAKILQELKNQHTAVTPESDAQ